MHFKDSLLKKGVKADISLEKERLDSPEGVEYFLWIPVKDHKAPAKKQLLVGARFIKSLVENKIKTYVHCKRGHGRSPTLVAAYYVLTGMKAEEAVEKIRKKRHVMHLTREQISALKRFEKEVKKWTKE